MLRKLKGVGDLAGLDRGVLDVVFRRKLAEITEDLMDRPTVDVARKLAITLSFKPVPADSGELSEVRFEAEAKCSLPVDRTRTINMGCKGKGELVHNDLSPHDHKQMTLDEVDNSASG